MNEELQNKLYNIGKILYQEKDLSITQTCMSWGFECPDSWYYILYELTTNLENLNEIYKNKLEIIATQVKEKYGSLHFYYNIIRYNMNDNEYENICALVNDFINIAENKSTQICCNCLNPATKTSKGWIMHYCDDCYKKIYDKSL